MLSKEDRKLLERARPSLIKYVDVQGTDLLGQLIRRGVLRVQQREIIEVGRSIMMMMIVR